MTEERWEDIKGMVKDKFEILEEKREPLELKTGLTETQKIGEKEIIIFNSPIGKTKLEYIVKPVVIDKKEHFSKRMGTTSQTEYILSDSDFSYRMEAFRWNEINNDWEKISGENFL